MALPHTVRPEHGGALPSMALPHTVRPEHKKAPTLGEGACYSRMLR